MTYNVKCRVTVPGTERRKTTNPLAAAVRPIAAPLVSVSGFREKTSIVTGEYCAQTSHINK